MNLKLKSEKSGNKALKKIRDVLAKLHDWLIRQADRSDLEFKLAQPQSLPNLVELKYAHRELLAGYVNTISGVSRLSFFVHLYEVFRTKKTPSIRRFVFYTINKYSPIRFLAIKPLVKLFVETHIKSKLRELEIIYIQLLSTIPDNHLEKENYLNWIKTAIEECKNLSKTLSSWSIVSDSIRWLITAFAGVIVSKYGADVFSTLLTNLIHTTHIQPATTIDIKNVVGAILFFLLLALYSAFFIDPSFQKKRDVFLGVSNRDDSNIYTMENNLFDLVSREKNKEFPLDYFGLTLSITLMFIYLFAANDAVKRIAQSNVNPNLIICNIFPALMLMVGLVFVVSVIVPIYKRWQSRLV